MIAYHYNRGGEGMFGWGGLNLGDLLCSPGMYFDIRSQKRVLIIGGGIQTKYILGTQSLPEGYDYACLWGGGLSARPNRDLDSNKSPFDRWGVRDRELVSDEEKWLPCVSCLHPMLDLAITLKNTEASPESPGLLYINSDPNIYSPRALIASRALAKSQDLEFCTNRASVDQFLSKWLSAKLVVTNSYHGAYWSLLAGKEVQLFGYNFKFQSLVTMFDLRWVPVTFTKGSAGSVIRATKHALSAKDPLFLENFEQVLFRFRDKQVRFAKGLVNDSFVSGVNIKPVKIEFFAVNGRRREASRILREYFARKTPQAMKALLRR